MFTPLCSASQSINQEARQAMPMAKQTQAINTTLLITTLVQHEYSGKRKKRSATCPSASLQLFKEQVLYCFTLWYKG